MQAALKLQLLEAASQPYLVAGNFQCRMARGKLGGDAAHQRGQAVCQYLAECQGARVAIRQVEFLRSIM
jgi:hypothetical protein